MKKISQIIILSLLFLPLTLSAQKIDFSRPYERFVGLGSCCLTRIQINAHLAKRYYRPAHAFGGSQLFDWVVIHDYEKLAEALENDLEDLFEPSDLLLGPSWYATYRCVKNIKYEMTWNHLFTRNQDDSIEEDIIEREYEIKKQKITYLSQKFKSLANYRTLYIISYPFKGKISTIQSKEPQLKTLIRVKNALVKLRGNANFDILYCSIAPKFCDVDHILVRPIVRDDPNSFTTDAQNICWHHLLTRFPFKFQNSNPSF